jgi:NAD(P)-dependent dehydrogenase (short-subunit alcohol dehydrogenase family)
MDDFEEAANYEIDGQLAAQLQLNLTSAAPVSKHALRRMYEVGEGRIMHTASRAALVTAGHGFAYSVSKLGVLHLVDMAAAETCGTAIAVNAVVPSIIDTPANRAAMPSSDHARWPKADQVAAVYLFLASPAAGLISGAAIPVYGLAWCAVSGRRESFLPQPACSLPIDPL